MVYAQSVAEAFHQIIEKREGDFMKKTNEETILRNKRNAELRHKKQVEEAKKLEEDQKKKREEENKLKEEEEYIRNLELESKSKLTKSKMNIYEQEQLTLQKDDQEKKIVQLLLKQEELRTYNNYRRTSFSRENNFGENNKRKIWSYSLLCEFFS